MQTQNNEIIRNCKEPSAHTVYADHLINIIVVLYLYPAASISHKAQRYLSHSILLSETSGLLCEP